MVMLASEVQMVGDTPPVKGESEILPSIEAGEVESPILRQQGRKMALRSVSARGRRTISKPKSPLLRMAEMRKSGLRGKAFRQANKAGCDTLESRASKGSKGSGGKGSRSLESIPEAAEVGAGCSEGLRLLDHVNETSGVEMMEDPLEGSSSLRLEETLSNQEWQKDPIPAGGVNDCALDLVSAQPLQEMVFVSEQVLLNRPMEVLVSGSLKGGFNFSNGKGEKGGEDSVEQGAEETVHDKEFPPLSKEGLRLDREKGKNSNIGGEDNPNKEGPSGALFHAPDGNIRGGGKNYKASLTSGGNMRSNLPVSFEPEKILKIGISGETAGLPSIQFSGAETSFLAEKLGYAVVGKFSHSFPASFQIQKALQGMRFMGEFSWRYINAKHVLIQFKLIGDYAKLLSGPNGMPMWFIDRHPMRVFKWTPDFDPYF